MGSGYRLAARFENCSNEACSSTSVRTVADAVIEVIERELGLTVPPSPPPDPRPAHPSPTPATNNSAWTTCYP
eukprot:scaffold22676_cov60-Phaeocystis_antarctica.AAC.4